jgi:hypothetical protein
VALVKEGGTLSGVVRRASLATALIVAAMAVSAAANASDGLRATFSKPIPTNTFPGGHVRIAWKLRDSAGHPVSLKHVFVTIVCPTGTDSTTAYAKVSAPGRYSANAVVPPGGIGTVRIGTKGQTIRITNPFHR